MVNWGAMLPDTVRLVAFTEGWAVGADDLYTQIYHRPEMAISEYLLSPEIQYEDWSIYGLFEGKVQNLVGYFNKRLRDALFSSVNWSALDRKISNNYDIADGGND